MSPSRTRPSRPHATPTLSVIIASTRERSQLDRCLRAVRPQCDRAAAELIVARAGGLEDVVALRREMPGVAVLAGPAHATVRQLRALGMTSATGDIVALTDDDRVPNDSWLDALRRVGAT